MPKVEDNEPNTQLIKISANKSRTRSPSSPSRERRKTSGQLLDIHKSRSQTKGRSSVDISSSRGRSSASPRRLSIPSNDKLPVATNQTTGSSRTSLQPSPTRDTIPLIGIKSLPAQTDEVRNGTTTASTKSGMSFRDNLKLQPPATTTRTSVSATSSPHKKRRGVRIPEIEDPTVSLLQTVDDVNTLDIWLHKKGGEFEIFDGKLVVLPGNYNSKKDFITVKRITERSRKTHIPELSRLEKINGDIYDFSTNKKHLKQPVQVWLPCHPITHPHLQEIKLKAKYKGDEEWVYHQWTLSGEDPMYPVIEFTAETLGTFVATVQPRVERLTVTDQGLLYNARINRYISLRFPKKCVDHDTNIEIRILPFNMEKAAIVKEDFKFTHPDLTDFELATDYFDIMSDVSTFRRSVSVKIPTGIDDFNEDHREEIIIMRKDLETGQWSVVESNMKITRTTVSFDTKSLGSEGVSKRRKNIFSVQFDTKSLGRFIILKAHPKRKLRMKNALPVLETKMTKCRREILIFKKLLKKSWNIWVELVKPSHVATVIQRRENDGLVCISQPENISTDLDGKPEYAVPVLFQTPQPENAVTLTASEEEFAKDLGGSKSNTNSGTDLFINIYDADDDVNNNQTTKSASRKMSRAKSLKKEYDYLELDDGTDCGLVELFGNVQVVEETPLQPFFLENHQDNFMTFEIEPKEADIEGDIETVIKYYIENRSASDGLVTKTVMRECAFTITSEQVADYFWVEPEPEPEVEEPVKEEELSPESVVTKEMLTPKEAAKITADRIKEQADTVLRLSAPSRPKQMIYREPRVLSGRSLQTLSRLIDEGLTLAVYLDMPDSTITGIGFDALSNGLSLADVTYRILLRWKRGTRVKGDGAVEELTNALRSMGRQDIVAIMMERHHRNAELTPSCFASLHADDEPEDLRDFHTGNVVPVKQFAF